MKHKVPIIFSASFVSSMCSCKVSSCYDWPAEHFPTKFVLAVPNMIVGQHEFGMISWVCIWNPCKTKRK